MTLDDPLGVMFVALAVFLIFMSVAMLVDILVGTRRARQHLQSLSLRARVGEYTRSPR